MKSHDGVALIMLAAEQSLQIETVEDFLDLVELAGGLAEGFLVLGCQLEIYTSVLELVDLLSPGRERLAQRRALAQKLLGFLTIVPEVGCRRRVVQLPNANLPVRNVKDTSRTPRGVPRQLPRAVRARSDRRS
jgi:hypothetical protein